MTIAAVDKITALQNHMSSFIDMTSDGKLMTQEYTAFLNKKTAEYQVQREKKIAELQADMDALDTRLNILRTVIVAALEDTVEPGEILNKKLCAVCFENEVNMAAVPCGHTLCGDCSKSTGLDRVSTNATRARPAFLSHSEQPKCPHCRSQVSSVVKLYFSV
jgi:polyhydroxyalkanoate synthesis regulator phasin